MVATIVSSRSARRGSLVAGDRSAPRLPDRCRGRLLAFCTGIEIMTSTGDRRRAADVARLIARCRLGPALLMARATHVRAPARKPFSAERMAQ